MVTGEVLSNRGKIGASLILAGVLLVEVRVGKDQLRVGKRENLQV
jgi:drug/metabolite transporter (DMT)-like permease